MDSEEYYKLKYLKYKLKYKNLLIGGKPITNDIPSDEDIKQLVIEIIDIGFIIDTLLDPNPVFYFQVVMILQKLSDIFKNDKSLVSIHEKLSNIFKNDKSPKEIFTKLNEYYCEKNENIINISNVSI